jgi:acyl transferase domain-containing protein
MPSYSKQAESMQMAIKNADVPAESISYIELAAAGSSVADASEIKAVKRMLRDYSGAPAPCYIGSVAANIGHHESASGMSQVTKVILQLKHKLLAPAINFKPVSPMLQPEESELKIVEKVMPWSCMNKKNSDENNKYRELQLNGMILMTGEKKEFLFLPTLLQRKDIGFGKKKQ